ncbi:MAG: PAS domain S-box protein [Bacteroidia bacterium]
MFNFRIESGVQHAYPSIVNALDAAGIAFFIKNSQLEYIHANQNFLDLINCKDITNLSDSDVFVPDVASEQRQIEELIMTTQLSKSSEAVIVGRNKLEKVLGIERSLYKEGDEYYMVGVVQDLTIQKEQEQFNAYKKVLTGEELHEKVINRFSSYIFNNNDEQVILDGVGKLCLELLKIDDVSIFIYSPEQDLLEQRTFVGKDDQLQYEKHNPVKIKLNQGIVGLAATEMKSVLLNDVDQNERHIKGVVDAKSELAVPIIYKKKLIGVIDSENPQNQFFTKRHVHLMEGIAGLLAIKLNEVRNYRLLTRKQMQMQAFVENSPVALIMLDEQFNYLAVSESWKNTYDVDPSENLIGQNHFERYPNLPIRWKKMIKKALAGVAQRNDKEFYQRKNGTSEWYTAKVSPWYTKKNGIGGVILNAEIITDQVRQEQALTNTMDALQKARIMGKLYTWDFNPENGKFTWSTGLIEDGEWASADHLQLESLFEVVDPEYRADFNNAIQEAIKKKSEFSLIHPIQIEDKKLWLHTRGGLKTLENQVECIVGTSQDITDQVLTEDSLKRKNKELEKINAELDQFVYKTAHDLRTPLTNLVGLIGVMRNESNLDLLNTYFDLQEKSVEKMDAFIHKITNFTKNSRLPVQCEELNFNSMIDDILGEYLFFDKSELITKSLEIKTDIPVYGDCERIKSIVRNLISNAIKYADLNKDQPSIKVSVSTSHANVKISIKDNGVGIPEKIKPRVFEMFYRGSKISEGSGIGLYIVKEAVSKLSGKISLNSEEHIGTEVVVTIPNLNPSILSK